MSKLLAFRVTLLGIVLGGLLNATAKTPPTHIAHRGVLVVGSMLFGGCKDLMKAEQHSLNNAAVRACESADLSSGELGAGR
jgi:hypothetical protein